MNISGYLNEIRELAQTGRATEHSYRPALERLFKSIDSDLTVINEPKRLTDVGAPDFVFDRSGVSIGWCEAKDLFKDITKFKANDYSKEQRARYAKGLPNLIYTNGTDFEFIVKGEVTGFVSIADLIPTLPARPDQFARLEMLLKDFASQTPISINTARQLAEMMAGKAVLIKDIMGNALVADTAAGISTELTDQYEGFKTSLIHDITIADFADVYAETIAYGLFAARLHDTSLDTFGRAEALELLPKSNPFLRNLFVYIAGPNLDDRLRRMIDDLCDVFRACDVGALMQDFGKFTARNDPFLHFYETFLAEYNPAKRKARGVWYTPEPVVNFIVRAVDDVLKTEFGLPMGLADTSKISIDWDSGQNDPKTGKPVMVKKDVHRVQILDPATGTGTFLAEAIKQIAAQVKGVAEGMWSSYVERDLIPRLHGFELLMASYAMCHMKLDMMLTDMGYKPSSSPPRLGVYLTNSLEEGERVEQTLPFARWLSEEAKGANTIKRDTPIMCVIGNPPYSGISQNNGDWITGLIEDYKYVDGVHFGERKHWLQDDYVKFIRFAETMIEKNGEGILGFITNHGYLDNPTFRGMRWHLMRSFDSIHVLNLHGNSKRKEVSPDGSPDVNVFDIQQGVSIIIAVRKRHSGPRMAKVLHGELWGKREEKYLALFDGSHRQMSSLELDPVNRYFMFYPIDNRMLDLYDAGFGIAEFFGQGSSAFVTGRDGVNISFSGNEAAEKLEFISTASDSDIRQRFGPNFKDSRDWTVATAKADAVENGKSAGITACTYRAFDTRFTCYTGRSRGLYSSPQPSSFSGHREKDYLALATARINSGTGGPCYILAVSQICDFHLCSDSTSNFPLYLYPEEGTLETERRVNFDPTIYAEICGKAGLSGADGDELRVFDYIYGVLHSPDYRRTYAQFLKIDFPRVPYPASPAVFAHVADKGGQLRRLHLMEPAAIGATPFPFKGDGDNVVVKPAFAPDSPSPLGKALRCHPSPSANGGSTPAVTPHPQPLPNGEGSQELAPPRSGEDLGRVQINPDQWFEGVPQVAWEFHIGGYQPAQKWLKDRKGRALSFDDVIHYQKIIKILIETDRIMREIELPLD